MGGRVGIIWDCPLMFTRLVEDCGQIPELVSPQLLAAPFFRRSYSTIIIPGGFANPSYSSVLPALRACEGRIRKFVTNGGVVIAFGAGIDRPDAYDWLPVQIRYRFGFTEGVPSWEKDNPLCCIIEECPDTVSIDGTFEMGGFAHGNAESPVIPLVHMKMHDFPVLLEYMVGSGRIILTSLHEYPSRGFLTRICDSDSETLL